MSCACENSSLGKERERIRRLAKAWAKMEGKTAVLFLRDNGSYDFADKNTETDNKIIEYITPY